MERTEYVTDKRVPDSGYIRKPMQYDYKDGAEYRWYKKPVLHSRLLDCMEDMSNWIHHGPGELKLTSDRHIDGRHSLRLSSPTKTSYCEGAYIGRPFTISGAKRLFAGEDWRDCNRISLWVYPTAPGFTIISLELVLFNDGEIKAPNRYLKESFHYQNFKVGQWNHLLWEIENIARDKVTALDIRYRLQGNEPGAAETVHFDLDCLMLEKVEPDYYEGWAVAPGHIAYSHTGYHAGSAKTAFASDLKADSFSIVEARKGEKILTKPVETIKSRLGEYQVMDFSEIRNAGTYFIHAGDMLTRPFKIDDNIWRGTVWKQLNFYFCERCGYDIPGVHGVCHRDWQSRNGDRKIVINGGWHDAGDLSQFSNNTAQSAYAMLSLVEKYKDSDPQLAERLLEEAKWGLDWMLKTRFGNGYRSTWSCMDFWSDGIMEKETVIDECTDRPSLWSKLAKQPFLCDDVVTEADNRPLYNYVGAQVEAKAARVLSHIEPVLSSVTLQAAEADFRFAVESSEELTIELAAEAALAAVELYRATGKEEYADRAAAMTAYVTNCQQKDIIPWDTPFCGFFYQETTHEHIWNHFHLSSEQSAAMALAGMCELFPDHPQWMKWYATLVLYSEYLRTGAEYSKPYHMLPAGVYNIQESVKPNGWGWDISKPHFIEQIQAGIRINESLYFRYFPVWPEQRGNSGVLLSQAKALSVAAHVRNSKELADLCQKQLQWIVGRNPFGTSIMTGEGYNFEPLFLPFIGDTAGGIPTGIFTYEERDTPYWPKTAAPNYKEVWVHVNARWLQVVEDMDGPVEIYGQVHPHIREVEFIDKTTGSYEIVRPDRASGRFQAVMSPGEYVVRYGGFEKKAVFLPAGKAFMNLEQYYDYSISQNTSVTGKVSIEICVTGRGKVDFSLRVDNLQLQNDTLSVELADGETKKFVFVGEVKNIKQPWVAVLIPNGDIQDKRDIMGSVC